MQEMEAVLGGTLGCTNPPSPPRSFIQISIVNAENGWVISEFGDSTASRTFVAEKPSDVTDIVFDLIDCFKVAEKPSEMLQYWKNQLKSRGCNTSDFEKLIADFKAGRGS